MYVFLILLNNIFILICLCNFSTFYLFTQLFVESLNINRNISNEKYRIPYKIFIILPKYNYRSNYLFINNGYLPKYHNNKLLSHSSDLQHTLSIENHSNFKHLNEKIKYRIDNGSAILLDDKITKFEFIEKLAGLGRSIYSDSPKPSLFKTVPDSLDLLKSFDTNYFDTLGSCDRNYFVVKSPGVVEYKLLSDCSSSVYLSVFVDKDEYVYIDGVSDSLIYKGIVSLLISQINGRKYKELESINIKEHGCFKRLAEYGILSKRSIDIYLDHIKKQCDLQINSDKKIKDSFVKYSSTQGKRVAVLLSGGVDSSLSLWMLKNRGFNVEAFYLKVNDLSEGAGVCMSNDIEYAMKVCENLDVTLNVLPFSKVYYDNIIDEFVENYRKGEVPNPDVLCNSRIKFGEFLKRALDWGFDFVASGHYASLIDDVVTSKQIDHSFDLEGCRSIGNDRYRIKRLCLSKDHNKDQTYFLSRLNQRQLSRLMFPLAGFSKSQVRELAKVAELPTFDKDDSVGLCFLESLDISDFLTKKLGKNCGPIVEYDTGEVIGEHTGLYNYAIGQRKGLNNYIFRTSSPNIHRYVVKKDVDKNTLYVSRSYNSSEFTKPEGPRSSFKVTDIFWNVPDYKNLLDKAKVENSSNDLNSYHIKVKLRHSPKFHESTVNFIDNNNANVFLKNPDTGISTGQYCVFYIDSYCIGSGKMITTDISI